MTTKELIEKTNEALAACLDATRKRAEGQEALNAKNFADAASTLCVVRCNLISSMHEAKQVEQ